MTNKWLKLLKEHFPNQVLGAREDRGEISLWVTSGVWLEVARKCKESGFTRATDLTAVDYADRDPRFDVNLLLTHPELKQTLRLKTMVDEYGSIPSLVTLWKGINWWEREVFDLFGIRFEDHPKLKRLLLPSDYEGHPLRKDFPVTGPLDSPYR